RSACALPRPVPRGRARRGARRRVARARPEPPAAGGGMITSKFPGSTADDALPRRPRLQPGSWPHAPFNLQYTGRYENLTARRSAIRPRFVAPLTARRSSLSAIPALRAGVGHGGGFANRGGLVRDPTTLLGSPAPQMPRFPKPDPGPARGNTSAVKPSLRRSHLAIRTPVPPIPFR